jgi:alkylation response protein AidB-like acyl-CoA dehydrogenase
VSHAATNREFQDLVETGALDLETPGAGATAKRWAALAALGRRDPVLARLAEGHADAVAILAELGATDPPTGSVWGVWAAVPRAVQARPAADGWRLTGDRPWCSGAEVCTHALVTAQAQDGTRLFAVELAGPTVQALDGTWPAIGMARSDSRTVRFTDTPATAIGDVDDYVNRAGFWQGSMGVAACWFGGALGVADTLYTAAQTKPLDPHALAHLGAVDAALTAARVVLADAAHHVDTHPTRQQPVLARRVRATIESCATEVMDRVGRALGAGPLCLDGQHSSRIADLTVYLRQSHAERDLQALGELVASQPGNPWEISW